MGVKSCGDEMMPVVALSAGHYPDRCGASYGGQNEHELAIDWCKHILKKLSISGISVIQVPSTNLTDKVDFINHLFKVDIAIEIHFNDSFFKNAGGCETLYCPDSIEGFLLASYVHGWYAVTMGNKDRGIKPGWYRMIPHTIKNYFLRKTTCPAIILEPEFIYNMKVINEQKLTACNAIASGIINYFERDQST